MNKMMMKICIRKKDFSPKEKKRSFYFDAVLWFLRRYEKTGGGEIANNNFIFNEIIL